MTQSFRVTTRFACYRVDVLHGVVTFAAPIAHWCVGMPWIVARQKLEVRGGAFIEELWTQEELDLAAGRALAQRKEWGA